MNEEQQKLVEEFHKIKKEMYKFIDDSSYTSTFWKPYGRETKFPCQNPKSEDIEKLREIRIRYCAAIDALRAVGIALR